MPEKNFPPEFEQQLRQALDVPAPDPDSLDTLREHFIARGAAQLRSPDGRASRSVPRFLFPAPAWKFALAVLAVVSVLGALAFFSPQVVNALRGLFGYIPSVGVVDQTAGVLVLEEPVQATLGEISLTVERAIATREKTVIVYQYKAVPWDGRKYRYAETLSPDQPTLLLLDGARLDVVSGRRQPGDDGAIRYALEFGPLPANVTAVTLQLDRLAGMPPELSPKNWAIPLRFQPGDPSEIVFPVTEYVPSPEPTAAPVAAGETPAASVSPAYGASITLERSVTLPDGYLLMGNFRWTDTTLGQNELDLGMPVMTDRSGQTVEYEIAPLDAYPAPGELRQNWAFKIPNKTFAPPLRVEFYVTRHESASVPFQFDPGPNPRNEQTYELAVELPVNAHPVKIVSARHTVFGDAGHFFLFTLTADAYVIGANIIDPAHPPMGGGGGGNGIPLPNLPFSSGVMLEGELPPGPLSLQIAGLDVLVPGDWVLSWSPE